MKACGCREDPVAVGDWCYFHLKLASGLIFSWSPPSRDLSREQLSFIGVGDGHLATPPPTIDPWDALLRGLDTDPVQPWERTTPRRAGHGDG